MPNPRARLTLCSVVLALLVAGAPLAAAGVEIGISIDEPGCGALVTSGTGSCDVSGRADDTLVVTWALASQTAIGGYDLELRWDAGELGFVSAEQLYPDTGAAGGFTISPSASSPTNVSVLSFSQVPTTALFRVSFQLTGTPLADGLADVSWTPNGDGLSPAGALTNSGSGVDVVPEPGTLLMLAVGLAGFAATRRP